MPIYRTRLALALAIGMIAGSSLAQVEEPLEPAEDVDGVGVIVGGRPVSSRSWPATAISSTRVTDKNGRKINGRCTATAVGERVVLSAAHCVDDGESGAVKFKGKRYNITCNRHPQYSRDFTQDYALCKTEERIEGVSFEVINTSIAFPTVGNPVLLLGYGCTENGHNRDDNILYRSEDVNVVSLPNGRASQLSNFIVIKGESAVCYGDSGGAAYINIGGVGRRIFGVNAQGNISDTSYIAPTNTSSFIRFAVDWSAGTLKICGVHPEARNCRTN